MPMTEDMSVFFNADEFATEATHTPLGLAESEPASVIFDRNGLTLEEMGVQTEGPTVLIPSALWAVAEEDRITVAATAAYVVRAVTPLEDGALTLINLVKL